MNALITDSHPTNVWKRSGLELICLINRPEFTVICANHEGVTKKSRVRRNSIQVVVARITPALNRFYYTVRIILQLYHTVFLFFFFSANTHTHTHTLTQREWYFILKYSILLLLSTKMSWSSPHWCVSNRTCIYVLHFLLKHHHGAALRVPWFFIKYINMGTVRIIYRIVNLETTLFLGYS